LETKTALDKMIISKTTIYNKNLKKISMDCELGNYFAYPVRK
jgi:hypothetical protein